MSRDFRAGVDYPSVVCFTPREELCVFVSTIITIRIRKVTNGGQDFSGPEFRAGVDYSYRTYFMSGMFDMFITIKIRKVTRSLRHHLQHHLQHQLQHHGVTFLDTVVIFTYDGDGLHKKSPRIT
jgi:hypothetical protein